MTLCESPSSVQSFQKVFKISNISKSVQITLLLSIAEESRTFSGPNNLGQSLPVLSTSARLISSPECNWEQSLGYLRQNSTVCNVDIVTDFFCASPNIELTVTNHVPVNSLLEHLSFNFLLYKEKAEGLHHMDTKILSEIACYFISSCCPSTVWILVCCPYISSNYLLLTSARYCCSLLPKETRLCSCTAHPSFHLSDSFPSPS